MQDSRIKEDLSISYLLAVSANAGIACDTQRHDDSADVILRKTLQMENGYRYHAVLMVQVKSTSSKSQYKDHGTSITYQLKAKNYNDLCQRSSTPAVLALLVLPEDRDEWLHWSTEDLLLKGIMYWKKFQAGESSDNKGTVTVEIDKSNVINSETLDEILMDTAREA